MIKCENYTPTFQQRHQHLEAGRRTHIFLCRGKEKNYIPCTDGYYSQLKSSHPNLSKLFLFDTQEESSYHEWIKKCFSLNKYFGDVLCYKPLRGDFNGLDYTDIQAIIIPKEKVDALNKLIDKYKLSDYTDLIFYLVAKIQKIYCIEIRWDQETGEQKEVKETKKQGKALIEIVKKYRESKYNYGVISPPRLTKITFQFKDDKDKQKEKDENISIKDPGLLTLLMDAIAPICNEKNIEELEKYIKSQNLKFYTEHQFKNYFKKNLAESFLLFLEETGKFTTKNPMYIFIGRIYELALIIESEAFILDKNSHRHYSYGKVGKRSKTTSYEKFLIQSIKDLLS